MYRASLAVSRHRTLAIARRRGLQTAATPPQILWTYLPSHVPYEVGLALQEALVRYRIDSKNRAEFSSSPSTTTPDVLLLLQHTPVYTSGRREKDGEVLEVERQRLQAVAPGADYVMTMRGGQTTYHGPGQLTGYPILDLGPMAVRNPTPLNRPPSHTHRARE